MKRGLVVILGLFSLLIILSMVSAVDNSNNTTSINAGNFQTASNNVLNTQITIPDNLQLLTKILFGITSTDNIILSSFIVLIALWIFLLLIIQGVAEFIPIFGSGFKSWIAAFIITCLMALSGGIKDSASYLMGLGDTLTVLRNYGILTIIFFILIIGLLVMLSKDIMKKIKDKTNIMKTEVVAFRVGLGKKYGK